MAEPQDQFIEITSENVTEYRSLRRGDQIAVEGEKHGVEYYHHGIFLGHEKGVADFGGADKTEANVRQVDILEFTNCGRRRLVRFVYPKGYCLSYEEAAMNAEKLLKDPSRWGPYDLLKNNCEHFAAKCKTGIAVSRQVIDIMRKCLSNPIEMAKYAIAALKMQGGSSGSLGSLS